MSYITSIGVQITGIGTRNSTVTVPGVSSLNGTTVECLATGVLNGEQPYGNKSSSVLYIQGMEVILSWHAKSYCIVKLILACGLAACIYNSISQ